MSLKETMGIDRAACVTCFHLGSEDSGGDYPEHIWSTCEKIDKYNNLKSFPFKKEMSCWEPDFWFSKFADLVDGTDKSVDDAMEAFCIALKGDRQVIGQNQSPKEGK
jgi:hypothetical protein